MIKRKNEKGFSLILLVFIITVLGFVGIYGSQVMFAYFDKLSLEKTVRNVLQEERSNTQSNRVDIRRSILKSASINNIDITPQDIIVEGSNGGFLVEVEYTKIINITDNIYIVLDYVISEESTRYNQ